eukprot:CAMPEP_0119317708 /NCGR_PEP_ID=MMETSP1333-20130426/43961_1 /TAXON_ID=418940 /ORGANISM="Scyphosphaera apsteinii, Strain RCC1455" /LENGTH=170 /DNA_ID=CAMNT_0007323719 /DNA_START=32 /DNA_END=544 /DNA_ORIENTATION=+
MIRVAMPLLLQRLLPPSRTVAAPDITLPTALTTPSGLKCFDFRTGEGASPAFGQLVRFHYVGYTVTDEQDSLKVFDSTYWRKQPYLTKHGNGFTVQAIEEALHTMQPGGRRRVIVPALPAFTYTFDKGPLPPASNSRKQLFAAVEKSSPIVFDLELLSAFDDKFDRGDYD